MKILQVNNAHYMRGGSDRVYLETGALLAQAEHDVLWFAAAHAKNDPSEFEAYFPRPADLARANIGALPRYLYNRSAARALDRLLQDHGVPDVAHLHIYHGGLTAAILPVLRHHKVAIVHTAHEYKLACPVYTLQRGEQTCRACVNGSRLNLLRHRCKGGSLALSAAVLAESSISRLMGDVRHMDRILAISQFQQTILEQAGVPSSKLRLCYNGIDVDGFKPVPDREVADYFLYIGRIEVLKGLPTLIDAAKRTGLPLKIAGDGNWSQQLEAAIADCPTIEFLGFQNGANLRALVARSKALVVPSEWDEPFGLSVVEGMASGTPVIAAKSGGIPELIRDRVDGLLFPPGDRIQLADAMETLAKSNTSQMRKAARERARQSFGHDTYRKQLLNIYQEVRGTNGA